MRAPGDDRGSPSSWCPARRHHVLKPHRINRLTTAQHRSQTAIPNTYYTYCIKLCVLAHLAPKKSFAHHGFSSFSLSDKSLETRAERESSGVRGIPKSDSCTAMAVSETGCDLVVMASHVPNVMDHIWPSNGGKLAEHVKCSILVVRG